MVAQVQKPAPSFKATAVVDGGFKQVSLDEYKGQYVVFFWYPMDFTFVCPTEIIAFSDRIEEFKALNTAVIAASCDSEYSHLAWVNQPRKQGGLGEMKIPIISDMTKNIARDYGVLIEEAGVALRGLFIIDPKGIIRQITINDLPVGRSVDETLRLIEAFQFTDEHGEVCPANWTKGGKTIDTKNSKKYFESV
ncbi:Peroxiredoxin [Bifiguratus adelaidae]|uniref:thioredoxin-dependent peroxiredoxin n=1 Tax=Bifiguratus adelaidae TaxID=1938954 RepID=A0A261Y2L1_9FUNG|nr:Peroxiredoxin [Bifiguratus adelaidae]